MKNTKKDFTLLIKNYFENEFNAEQDFDFYEETEIRTIDITTKDFNGYIELEANCDIGTQIGGEYDEVLCDINNISYEVLELCLYDNEFNEIDFNENNIDVYNFIK